MAGEALGLQFSLATLSDNTGFGLLCVLCASALNLPFAYPRRPCPAARRSRGFGCAVVVSSTECSVATVSGDNR
jgi:hypothetical protein